MFLSQVQENIAIWIGAAQGEPALAGTDLLPRRPWPVERQPSKRTRPVDSLVAHRDWYGPSGKDPPVTEASAVSAAAAVDEAGGARGAAVAACRAAQAVSQGAVGEEARPGVRGTESTRSLRATR